MFTKKVKNHTQNSLSTIGSQKNVARSPSHRREARKVRGRKTTFKFCLSIFFTQQKINRLKPCQKTGDKFTLQKKTKRYNIQCRKRRFQNFQSLKLLIFLSRKEISLRTSLKQMTYHVVGVGVGKMFLSSCCPVFNLQQGQHKSSCLHRSSAVQMWKRKSPHLKEMVAQCSC